MCPWAQTQFSRVFTEALFTTVKNRDRQENARADSMAETTDGYAADMKIKTVHIFHAIKTNQNKSKPEKEGEKYFAA